MDSVTQAALGALCGELVLRRQLGNKGILWGAVIGTLPDLDVITYAFLEPMQQLYWHRGLSHSILMTVIVALLGTWLFPKRYPQVRKWRAALFFLLAWGTHILIDCFNAYGAQIFEPFSSKKVTLGNLFIIDVFFTLPMLFVLAWCLLKKKRLERRCSAWWVSLWLGVYVACSLLMRSQAEVEFRERLALDGVLPERVLVMPTFSNIFLWRQIAEDGGRFYSSHWSVLGNEGNSVHMVDKLDTAEFDASQALHDLEWFTMGWLVKHRQRGEDHAIYVDAWNIGSAHLGEGEVIPAFVWKLTHKDDGSYQVERAFKMTREGGGLMKKALPRLWQRLLGDAHGFEASH